MTTDDKIPALWFDKTGGGPSELALEIHPFAAEREGRIPASLGLRIHPVHQGLVLGRAQELPESGFMLGRAQVQALHTQLGAWLQSTASARSDKPSIADLQRREGLMTAGDWWVSDDDGEICTGPTGNSVAVGPVDWKGADVDGMIGLRNAGPVLLEIAATALAQRRQSVVAAKARQVLFRKEAPTDADYATTDVEDRKLKNCHTAYEAALDKVVP